MTAAAYQLPSFIVRPRRTEKGDPRHHGLVDHNHRGAHAAVFTH